MLTVYCETVALCSIALLQYKSATQGTMIVAMVFGKKICIENNNKKQSMMNMENKNNQEPAIKEKNLIPELLSRITELNERLEKMELKLNKPLIS